MHYSHHGFSPFHQIMNSDSQVCCQRGGSQAGLPTESSRRFWKHESQARCSGMSPRQHLGPGGFGIFLNDLLQCKVKNKHIGLQNKQGCVLLLWPLASLAYSGPCGSTTIERKSIVVYLWLMTCDPLEKVLLMLPIPFHSIPFHSIPLHSIPFHSISFHLIILGIWGKVGD